MALRFKINKIIRKLYRNFNKVHLNDAFENRVITDFAVINYVSPMIIMSMPFVNSILHIISYFHETIIHIWIMTNEYIYLWFGKIDYCNLEENDKEIGVWCLKAFVGLFPTELFLFIVAPFKSFHHKVFLQQMMKPIATLYV